MVRSGPGTGPELVARSIRTARDELAEAVLAGALRAGDLPRRYSDAVDAVLADLLERATEGKPRGYALLAVGGYGRRELCPGSDLDLVLLHRGRRGVEKVAEALWYAIWDEGLRLDHSVRTRREALGVARDDLKAILGLLDGRVVAGDAGLGEPLRAAVLELWQGQAPTMLPMLDSAVTARHHRAGELAFLLEPDLKQSAGGLRDAAALRALGLALPLVASAQDPIAVAEAERLILSARVALHCRAGSSNDRLLLQEQDQVAALLRMKDADVLMAAMAEAGRTISAASDEAWRRARRALRGPAETETVTTSIIEPGVVVRDGEVALAEGADPAGDPTLVVRVARAAAQRNVLIERESLDRLAAATSAPAEPWTPRLREAFLDLLQTGDALVPVVEALDRRGLFELFLPEWTVVRNRPQRNAYHRYTVDRHLLEAVARCCSHLSAVDRPDLLVMAALLHDIGKGTPGDHSEVGRDIAERVVRRMGFSDHDVAVLLRLVAYHLVLPEMATRRDLDDPSTAHVVARLVEDRRTLGLLAALTEADSLATGTSAWGPWKAELVATLTTRVGDVLDGRPLAAPAPPAMPPELVGAMQEGRLALRAFGRRVTVVAPDRPGLLAAVTGVLALHGCNVLRATAGAGTGDMAFEVFDVEPAFDRQPDWAAVEADVAGALNRSFELDERLEAQDRTYSRSRRPGAARPAQVAVTVDDTTSELASIVEVRAPDRLGLLHHVTATLASADLDVAAALVDTLGHEVVDTFYVRDREGRKLGATARAEAVRTLLAEVLARVC